MTILRVSEQVKYVSLCEFEVFATGEGALRVCADVGFWRWRRKGTAVLREQLLRSARPQMI